jgi:uncharacterized membrane protein
VTRALTPLDWAALAWFFVCWFGYAIFADRWRKSASLMAATGQHRLVWMKRMLARDNRIFDSTLVQGIARSPSFFAQTTIFILAGLMAALGAKDRATDVLADVPFAAPSAAAVFEVKIALLMLIFVFAFFKFTWSMRQFNYLFVLIGAAPLAEDKSADVTGIAERAARMGDLAVNHFNVGIRAYYFGLATLAWFIQPWLFILASTWIVLVLWRREFRSHTLAVLRE